SGGPPTRPHLQPRARHPSEHADRERQSRRRARARRDRIAGGRAVKAVLLLAHGTPESLDDMPEYLTRVRGGRPPSPELIEEMRHNYGAIGGGSPPPHITPAHAGGLPAPVGGTPV